MIGQVIVIMALDTSRRTAHCKVELHQKSLVDGTPELVRRILRENRVAALVADPDCDRQQKAEESCGASACPAGS